MIIQCQELILSRVIGSVKGSLIIDWLIKYCKIKAVQEKCMKTASETSQKYITSFTIGHAHSVQNKRLSNDSTEGEDIFKQLTYELTLKFKETCHYHFEGYECLETHYQTFPM